MLVSAGGPIFFMTWDSMTESVLDTCMDTFGVGTSGLVTYVSKEGPTFPLRGIFDNAFISVDPNTQAPVQSVGPVLGIKLSDLPRAPKVGDKVIVRDVPYQIDHVEKDVHGGASLFLHKL